MWEERGGERFQVEGQHPLRVKDLKKPGALGATARSSMTGAAGAAWAGGRWGCSVERLNLWFVSPCGCQSSKNQTLSQEGSTYRILHIISGIQAKFPNTRGIQRSHAVLCSVEPEWVLHLPAASLQDVLPQESPGAQQTQPECLAQPWCH